MLEAAIVRQTAGRYRVRRGDGRSCGWIQDAPPLNRRRPENDRHRQPSGKAGENRPDLTGERHGGQRWAGRPFVGRLFIGRPFVGWMTGVWTQASTRATGWRAQAGEGRKAGCAGATA